MAKHPQRLVDTRFDRVESHSRGDDRQIARVLLPQVPNPGEVVNVKGNPYVVVERGWAVGGDSDAEALLYAYLRVSPLQYRQEE
jgi:hypothetical protein